MNLIESCHKRNFEIKEITNIKEGDVLISKDRLTHVKVVSIHPMYGWITTEPYRIKQDWSNIDDYMVITSISTLKNGRQEAFCRFGNVNSINGWSFITKISL